MLKAIYRKLVTLADPLKRRQAELLNGGPLEDRIEFDAFSRPHFAYGIFKAAHQAKHLGLERISVMEFGVAGGNGLLAMEHIAAEVEAHLGVAIDVYGFDHGVGLPPPTDYRDLPYAWQTGQFEMDRAALEARLKKAKLVIGDVRETLAPFLAGRHAPLGFVSFDLDFYSSTISAFGVFDGPVLPRVYCYFDDVIGPDHEMHCEFVGELLAIEEFNTRSPERKLAKIHGLRYKRVFDAPWNESMFVLHSFAHPLYTRYIAPNVDMRLALG